MTDNQLRLLVRAWANALRREIDRLDESLPDGERYEEVGFSIWGYRKTSGYLTALMGLLDVLDELRQAENDLMETE